MAPFRRAQKLIETRIHGSAGEEVVQQVAHRRVARLPEGHPQTGLGEGQRLLDDDLTAHADNARGQGPARCVGDTPCLAENAHGGVDHVCGQIVGGSRQDERVGRERHIPLPHTYREVQLPRVAALSIELQISGHNLARSLGDELEFDAPRVPGFQGCDPLGALALKSQAAHPAHVEGHGDIVPDSLSDVRDRRAHLEVLAASDHRGHSKRDVEERIAHEHAAGSLPLHGDRSNRQSEQLGSEVEVDLVEALLLATNQELNLRLLGRGEFGDVVARARHTVGADAAHLSVQWLGDDATVPLQLGQREGVIGRAKLQIRAGRQLERGLDAPDIQLRAHGRSVRHVELS